MTILLGVLLGLVLGLLFGSLVGFIAGAITEAALFKIKSDSSIVIEAELLTQDS